MPTFLNFLGWYFVAGSFLAAFYLNAIWCKYHTSSRYLLSAVFVLVAWPAVLMVTLRLLLQRGQHRWLRRQYGKRKRYNQYAIRVAKKAKK